jgi:hypothetical protein
MQTYIQDGQYSVQEIEEARQILQRTMERLINSDLHPYQGEWLSTDEYQKRSEADSHKAQIHFREIIALNVAVALLSVFLVLLVALLCY